MSQSGTVTLSGAGVYAWTFTPNPPSPPPPVGPPIQVSDPGTITAGATLVTTIATNPPLAEIEIVAVHNQPPRFPWYGGAAGFDVVTLDATGAGTYSWQPQGNGDFLKYGAPGGRHLDTPGVIIKTVTPPPPPPSGGGLAVARALVTKIQCMANWERSRITYMTAGPGGPVLNTLQALHYWQKCVAHGLNAARIMYPWSPATFLNGGSGTGAGVVPNVGPGSLFAQMVSGALIMQRAGMIVEFVLQDLSDPAADDYNALSNQHLANAARAIAGSSLDPGALIVSPYNEMVGSSNAITNPLSAAAHDLLRQALPVSGGWVLGVQGSYWDSDTRISGGGGDPPRATVSDQQVVYECHRYPEANIAQNGVATLQDDFAGAQRRMQQWSAANGDVVTLLTEAGSWNPNNAPWGQRDPGRDAWAPTIIAMYTAAKAIRPAPWAITDGDMKLSAGGSDATIPQTILDAFAQAAAI